MALFAHPVEQVGDQRGGLVGAGGKALVGGCTIDLALDGKQFDLEIHFVHKTKSGEVAVVGVFVQADEKAEIDIPLSYDLPTKPGERVELESARNPSDFLPPSREYFTYAGSFTTPPCTEQIRWYVMKQPIGVPPKVLERFVAILKSNNRPVQNLYDRVVEKSK